MPLRGVEELFHFDGAVTLSGQYCTAGGQVLRSNPMPPDAVGELVAAAGDETFSCIFLEGEDIYVNCINDYTRRFISDLSIDMPPVRTARYALGRTVYQAVTFLDREHEHLLLDRAPHLKTTRWHPNFLDVIPPTGGKDRGLDAILEHFGIPLEESMAFGDGENDLSMLIHAGIGVAMGTASGEVKARADYAAPSVDEDGVARALEHNGAPVFSSGRAVLEGLTARQVGELARLWDRLDRRENPSPEDGEEAARPLKKAWSTRLMSAFAGVCSGRSGPCPPRSGPKA